MASLSEDENFHWSFQCQPSNFYFYNSKNCQWCGEHTWLWWLFNQLTSAAEKNQQLCTWSHLDLLLTRHVLHAFQNMGTIANILTWSTWPPARCTSWRSAALLSRAHRVYKVNYIINYSMITRVSQKKQKSEFWYATNPKWFSYVRWATRKKSSIMDP